MTTETISKIITDEINKIPGAEVDTHIHLLKEDTGDLKTPLTTATEVHHQLPKEKVNIEEIVATRIKATD
jgi:hypothetical protein